MLLSVGFDDLAKYRPRRTGTARDFFEINGGVFYMGLITVA
jgi:hypothetical protein